MLKRLKAISERLSKQSAISSVFALLFCESLERKRILLVNLLCFYCDLFEMMIG
jgi:hypothetical protein